MVQTDLIALAESLAMGLDAGSTTGDIIVFEAIMGDEIVPVSGGPPKHTAAAVLGYPGTPEVRNAHCISVRTCKERYLLVSKRS